MTNSRPSRHFYRQPEAKDPSDGLPRGEFRCLQMIIDDFRTKEVEPNMERRADDFLGWKSRECYVNPSLPYADIVARLVQDLKGSRLQALRVLADAVLSGEGASSGYLRERLGLTAEEWHGAGELLASLTCFAAERGFLDWHARSLVEESR